MNEPKVDCWEVRFASSDGSPTYITVAKKRQDGCNRYSLDALTDAKDYIDRSLGYRLCSLTDLRIYRDSVLLPYSCVDIF